MAAAAYDRGNPLLALERPETEALLPVMAGRDVLDVGSGTGHYARLAGALGARMAIAFDLTPEMLAKAPRPALVGDAARLPFASGSPTSRRRAVCRRRRSRGNAARAARVLLPGGRWCSRPCTRSLRSAAGPQLTGRTHGS